VTTDHVFESCFRTYREILAKQRRVSTSRLRAPSKSPARQTTLPSFSDYIADFHIIGSAALAILPGPLKLFRHLYLACGKYEVTLRELRISPETFDIWDSQIRETLGEVFRREKLWPRSSYFRGRARVPGKTPRPQRRPSTEATSNFPMGGAL
jgi:hypothetical protein